MTLKQEIDASFAAMDDRQLLDMARDAFLTCLTGDGFSLALGPWLQGQPDEERLQEAADDFVIRLRHRMLLWRTSARRRYSQAPVTLSPEGSQDG